MFIPQLQSLTENMNMIWQGILAKLEGSKQFLKNQYVNFRALRTSFQILVITYVVLVLFFPLTAAISLLVRPQRVVTVVIDLMPQINGRPMTEEEFNQLHAEQLAKEAVAFGSLVEIAWDKVDTTGESTLRYILDKGVWLGETRSYKITGIPATFTVNNREYTWTPRAGSFMSFSRECDGLNIYRYGLRIYRWQSINVSLGFC